MEEETLVLGRKSKEAFDFFNLSKTQQFLLETYGNLIKIKHEPTYCHSVRVALYGIKISKFTMLDPRMMLCAGLLHDIGKVAIDNDLLEKRSFTVADREKIREHSIYGYYILKGVHDFFAETTLRHHLYGLDGYPKILPLNRVYFSAMSEELIESYSKALAIIDFYDAVITREDNYQLQGAVKDSLIKNFPNLAEIIEFSYEKGVFVKEVIC